MFPTFPNLETSYSKVTEPVIFLHLAMRGYLGKFFRMSQMPSPFHTQSVSADWLLTMTFPFALLIASSMNYNGLRLFSRDDVPWKERLLSFVQRVLSGAKEAGHSYDVAFIDVLNKVKPRTDGSYDREYDALAPITQLAPNYVKALVVIHHTRKRDLKASPGTSALIDEALGSTALAGAFDTVVGLTRKEGMLTLNHESRLFEARRCGFLLADGRLRFSAQSDLDAADLRSSSPLQARIVELLGRRKVTRAGLAIELDVEISSISRAINSLEKKEIVLPSGRGDLLELAG